MEQQPKPQVNLHSRMGSMEARMDVVEGRLAIIDNRLVALEQGDVAMLQKLTENDERWRTVNDKLQVVEQIRDIQVTMSTIGKVFGAAAKAIRWGVTITAFVCGIYIAIHTGDLTSLGSLLSQFISWGG